MRVARVQISKEFFEMFVRAESGIPFTVYESNAPKDLEVLGFATSQDHPFTFEAYVKSESFPEVAEGAMPPLISSFVYTQKNLTLKQIEETLPEHLK